MLRILSLIINHAKTMLFDDDSSEEESNILEKVDNFAEHTVSMMNDHQFQMHFRMHPSTFEDLLQKLQHVYRFQTVGYPRISLEKEVMITLWYLSNLESFRSVSDRFGISKSSCWSVLYRTCNLLLTANQTYNIISWPTQARQTIIAHAFNNNGFPGIIGCIDGSHIPITAPKEFHTSYINRKGFHSVLLQGVCDHKMLFIDVYAAEPGSIHDYTLYKKSDLYRNIRAQRISFYDNNHLVGDLAYQLSVNLMVGFKNFGNLTNAQRHFNIILNQSRVKIENAYALLKGRFRRLKSVETVKLDLIALLIVSACILHNICILNGDLLEGFVNLDEERIQEINQQPNNDRDIEDDEARHNAVQKRNNIMNMLYHR